VAAIGFAFLQVSNRKANHVLDAYRTAFGFLVAVEVVLLVRFALLGDLGLLLSAPSSAVVIFGATTLFHFVGGWTLLALSQQTIGVARTGALVSSAAILGTLVAAIALDEPLTLASTGGVLLAVVVALISLSSGSEEWRRPWFGLAGPHTRAMAPHWLPIDG
jgi:drug/metabolite transporter (DMT)-like permease